VWCFTFSQTTTFELNSRDARLYRGAWWHGGEYGFPDTSRTLMALSYTDRWQSLQAEDENNWQRVYNVVLTWWKNPAFSVLPWLTSYGFCSNLEKRLFPTPREERWQESEGRCNTEGIRRWVDWPNAGATGRQQSSWREAGVVDVAGGRQRFVVTNAEVDVVVVTAGC